MDKECYTALLFGLPPVRPEQVAYNDALCRTCVYVEQAFGILKKAVCLHGELRMKPTSAITRNIDEAVGLDQDIHKVAFKLFHIFIFFVTNICV